MSIDTTSRIVKFLSILLDRKLSYDEKINLIPFINNIDTTDVDTNSIFYISDVAKKYYDIINKRQYTISKFLNETSYKQPSKAYLCLDSRYAIFNDTRTKLTWCVSDTLNDKNNIASLLGGVRNINWIRLQSIVVRKFNSTPQRATILIEELSAQSFSMPGGRKFHFVGLLNDLQNPIDVSGRNQAASFIPPDVMIFDKYELLLGYKFNEGYYRFNTPINMLNDITISIGNPDTLVVIPKYEYFNCDVAALTNSSITLELNEPHNLTSLNGFNNIGTWYSIFVDELNTNEANNISYDLYVNTHEHTDITLPTTTQIHIDFKDLAAGDGVWSLAPTNTQTYTSVPISQISKVRVRVNSYRVIINMELEYTN